ncbi:MAG: hypothetical protein VX589_18925 [Myxococcota bacterium]|nr:hypothetical protein [Myxococcota bacterium]
MRHAKGQPFLVCVCLFASISCRSTSSSISGLPEDAGIDATVDAGLTGNICGLNATILDIGADEPFTHVPNEDGRHVFQVFEGHQGGYHIDVSVRITGTLDPDEVDVAMRLENDANPVAVHSIDQWYLKLVDNRQHCEYPKGRLVFAEETGELFTLEQVEALLNLTLTLIVKMEASNESVSTSFKIVLTDVVRLSQNSDAGVESTP